MNRDPFYRQIIERLQGKLDPDLFESCAADLLREAYPTLVAGHSAGVNFDSTNDVLRWQISGRCWCAAVDDEEVTFPLSPGFG
jgi:hypothetical protein